MRRYRLLLVAGILLTHQALAAEPPGKGTYESTCIACHGPDGKGAVPGAPDLTGPKSPLAQPDKVVMKRMIEGFQSPGSPMAMPPKGGNSSLTERDIEEVLRYMRATFRR